MYTDSQRYDYEMLPEEQRIKIAQLIAQDNLERVNSICREITVKKTIYTKYIKRGVDIVISLLALIVSFPLSFIIGIVTFFDVGIPIFFKQVRIGKNHKHFQMIKFRNMTNERDKNGMLLRADKRVTKWGAFVRRASLDELLNFVSVFKGDMSLIGPRPLPIIYEGRFNKFHEARHKVTPGLDCPLQDPLKKMTWQNRLDNDVWYAEHIGFWTDLKMTYLLIREVFSGADKNARSQGYSEGTFVGYFEDGRVMDSNHIPQKYYDTVCETEVSE